MNQHAKFIRICQTKAELVQCFMFIQNNMTVSVTADNANIFLHFEINVVFTLKYTTREM